MSLEITEDQIAAFPPEAQAVIRALLAHNAELEKRVQELEARLAKAEKNSGNSSKPPSSDIVKPRQSKGTCGKRKKRKRGAQPGHQRHTREPFPDSEMDFFFHYSWSECPHCFGRVEASAAPPRVHQQVELVARPIEVSEHQSRPCWCPQCQKTCYCPIPDDVKRAGLVGPRLTALVAYMKGSCHASFSTIHAFLRDVVGIRISRGQLRKLCGKVSESLEPAYNELLDVLPTQPILNVDETGHKDNGQRMWPWCFRASLFTLFKIDPSRGSDVLFEVLGQEFNGVLGCDYFSAYRKYMGECDVLVQFCLAHLIRDIKFLTEHPNSKNRAYGRRVLKAVRALFDLIRRRSEIQDDEFASLLEDAGNELWGQATWRVPATSEATNLANRFEKHGASYIRFITTPGIDPTNNLAEQAIRFVVIDRRVTQGSRSQTGQRWLERIWTVIATCTQQGRSVFEFLYESVQASMLRTMTPSLAPNT